MALVQITAPRRQFRSPIVTGLVVGAFAVGLLAGVGGLRTVESVSQANGAAQALPIAGRNADGQAHDLIVYGSHGGGIRYTGIPYPAPERQP